MHQVTPVIMGATAAALAVVAQAFLTVEPPPAYGLCIVCHGRDLAVWLFALVTSAKLQVAQISTAWPLLTVVGIFIGSRYAARENGEYKSQWVEHPGVAFLSGAGVMVLGLILMACPARLLLRAAYGDLIAAVAMIAVLIGTVLVTLVMRWRVR